MCHIPVYKVFIKVVFTVKLTVNTLLHSCLKIRGTALCTDTGFEHGSADNNAGCIAQLRVKAGKCSTLVLFLIEGLSSTFPNRIYSKCISEKKKTASVINVKPFMEWDV